MSRKRRSFDPEFKLEALRLAQQDGMTATAAARQLGISTSLIYRWRRELASDPDSAFPGNGVRKVDDEKMVRLERENAKRRAVVAVARKLACVLHRLWITQDEYQPLRAQARAVA